MIYCLVDVSGNVANIIVYDGISPYTPPSGYTLQLDPAQQAGIGWAYVNGVFTNPNVGS